MAYDVDFWYLSQDACEIRTDFTPFSEHEEESIYMKTSDFFEMIEKFTDPDLERKAKAFDEIKEYIDKEGDSFMVMYRETKDPTYSLLNSHYDALLGYIEELEDGLDGDV